MKKSMMIVAALAAIGISGLSDAAQQDQKSDQERVRAVYAVGAKKCNGLSGDAKADCLKVGAGSRGKDQGASPGRKSPSEKY